MESEALVISIAALVLFAIFIGVIFFIKVRTYKNNKHLDDDYRNEIDDEMDDY